MSDPFRMAKIVAEYGARGGFLRYSTELHHNGLNEHRRVSDKDKNVLNTKILLQKAKWDEKWQRIEAKRQAQDEKEANLEEAQKRTEDAQQAFRDIDELLLHTLGVNDAVDWEELKDRTAFPEPPPRKPSEPKPIAVLAEPRRSDPKYQPNFTIFDHLLTFLKENSSKRRIPSIAMT